ncbi:MAG TPA: hypothetical protein VGO36_05270 [Solirubrobacterales bacterium]|jgi:hypothetical protein|nr:hypothetical protein [Solirubrobacterales bacterium]
MANNPTHAEVSQLPQPGERPDLAAELAREREEVGRLRDLLIARDAELGAARGKLAMIEQSSRRLGEAAARVPIPGATRLLQGLIRLVQRAVR